MIAISVEVILSQKVLPYDVYDSEHEKLFSAGEILTQGKIAKLRTYDILFIRPEEQEGRYHTKEAVVFEPIPVGKVNKISKINPHSQLGLKKDYSEAVLALLRGETNMARKMFLSIRDNIFKETQAAKKNVHYCSQLKLLGEHSECHALNTAIYTSFLAGKLACSELVVLDAILAALLHDIGKTKLPEAFFTTQDLNKLDEAVYRKHCVFGYNIILNKLKFPDNIAKVALEHHETMDGTGWPFGISNTMISDLTQIVSVCNKFDVLTSNRSISEVRSFRDALRSLLAAGSKTYSPKPLYAFVHMLNYGDTISFEELLEWK